MLGISTKASEARAEEESRRVVGLVVKRGMVVGPKHIKPRKNVRGPNHLIHTVRWKCWLHACVLSHFGHLQLCLTPWTVAHHALLSIGFSRQEYWSGFPCPPPGHLPHPGIEPVSLMSPALAGMLFTTRTTGKPLEMLATQML